MINNIDLISCSSKKSLICEQKKIIDSNESQENLFLTKKYFQNTEFSNFEELWSWGSNEYGQLGHRDTVNRFFYIF